MVAPLPKWFPVANVVTKFLLRRGLAFGPPELLSVPGRASGQLRTTPVSPVTVAGQRYIVAGFADADWVKNARAAGWGLIGRGPQLDRVGLTELLLAERPAIIQQFVRQIRGGRGFVTVPPEAPLAEFVQVADRFPVFRLDATAIALGAVFHDQPAHRS